MPLHRGSDSNGPFYQWGGRGKKYYYKSGSSAQRAKAKEKAMKQAKAIAWRRYSGGKDKKKPRS